MKVTLREISRQANVHYATASHILNGAKGSTRVSEDTRRRVLAVADSLGYRANRAAQQLKTRRSRVVGLLTGGLENPFFARMVTLCSEALEHEGYDVVLTTRRRDESSDLHLLEALVSRQLDGILLWSETLTEVRERVQKPDMANAVVMGLQIPGRDSVHGELAQGVRDALAHLDERGYQNVGYFAPMIALDRPGDPRHREYLRWMWDAGREPRIFVFDGSAYDVAAARDRAEALAEEIAQTPRAKRPDALFCFNDMAAIGVMMGLRRRGLRVPDDIALVGCDDLPLAAQMDVPLTTIAYPITEMCRTAVRFLMERIDCPDREEGAAAPLLPARHTVLPARLIVRASSGGGQRQAPTADPGTKASGGMLTGTGTTGYNGEYCPDGFGYAAGNKKIVGGRVSLMPKQASPWFRQCVNAEKIGGAVAAR